MSIRMFERCMNQFYLSHPTHCNRAISFGQQSLPNQPLSRLPEKVAPTANSYFFPLWTLKVLRLLFAELFFTQFC